MSKRIYGKTLQKLRRWRANSTDHLAVMHCGKLVGNLLNIKKKKSVKIFQRSFLFKQNYSWCFVLIFFFFKESFGFSMCFLWKKCWEQVFSLLVMIPTPSSHCWHTDYKRLSSCLSHHQLFCSLYGNLPSTALLCMATL